MRRRLAVLALTAAALAAGVTLRVFRWRDWPPGPWIDEAYALRAARLLAVTPGASLAGTSPLEPPDAGFVNHWPPNLYLRFASLLDHLAGGGIASFRLVSIGPSIALLLAGLLLAREAARGDPLVFAVAAAGLATSGWLLSTGRWGWDVPATSAVSVLAAWAALLSARRGDAWLAAAAGTLLGLAQYGYAAARPLLLVPLVPLALAVLARGRSSTSPGLPAVRTGREESAAARRIGLAVVVTLAVAAPLGLHLASHPERALARAREVSVVVRPPALALEGIGRNLASYAALFTVRGDPNERHGDPARPVLPPLLTVLALAGTASGARWGGPGRLLALAAGLVLLAGVTTAPEEGGNAYRTALAAPFLLVLAGLGARALVRALPESRRRLGGALLGAAVVATAGSEASGFASWASSASLRGAFGGPERELADALAGELGAGAAEAVVAADATRNPFVVDALLGAPGGGGAPRIRLARSLAPLRFVPRGPLLWADRAEPSRDAAAEALGARCVARGPGAGSFPGWSLFRLDAAVALRLSGESLARFPVLPSPGRGRLLAREDGLTTLSARGGIEVLLDGAVVFDPVRRPAGEVTVRLAPGPHELLVRRHAPGAAVRVEGPGGFVIPVDG